MDGQISTVNNPKKAHGDLKPGIHFIPMRVMLGVAKVMALGARKYGLRNWRKQPIAASTYYDAMYRHMVAWYEDYEDMDLESQEHHLCHVIAGCVLVLDAMHYHTYIDDRNASEVLVK